MAQAISKGEAKAGTERSAIGPNFLSRTALATLYPDPCPLSISHLSADDMRLYASILSHQPFGSTASPATGKAYVKRTTTLINTLPAHLVNPTPLHILPQAPLMNAFSNIGAGEALPSTASLCHLHRKLNAQVIASALEFMEAEVEDHLPELERRNLTRQTEKSSSDFAVLIHQLHLSAAALLAPRMPPEEFMYFYRSPPPTSWIKTTSVYCPKCGGCVLARVGSDRNILVALRASLLSRATPLVKAGRQKWIPLQWVESWIKALGADGVRVLMRSGKVAAWANGESDVGESSRAEASITKKTAGIGLDASSQEIKDEQLIPDVLWPRAQLEEETHSSSLPEQSSARNSYNDSAISLPSMLLGDDITEARRILTTPSGSTPSGSSDLCRPSATRPRAPASKQATSSKTVVAAFATPAVASPAIATRTTTLLPMLPATTYVPPTPTPAPRKISSHARGPSHGPPLPIPPRRSSRRPPPVPVSIENSASPPAISMYVKEAAPRPSRPPMTSRSSFSPSTESRVKTAGVVASPKALPSLKERPLTALYQYTSDHQYQYSRPPLTPHSKPTDNTIKLGRLVPYLRASNTPASSPMFGSQGHGSLDEQLEQRAPSNTVDRQDTQASPRAPLTSGTRAIDFAHTPQIPQRLASRRAMSRPLHTSKSPDITAADLDDSILSRAILNNRQGMTMSPDPGLPPRVRYESKPVLRKGN